MATLQAIGSNLAFGTAVAIVSLLAFGTTVRLKTFNDKIAPRTWARPKQVLTNALSGGRKDNHHHHQHQQQNCFWGLYSFYWIPWALGLSYQELMDGIPGTGTRNNGWDGPLLKCNLDGIILIKYHALALKVSILATVLCLLIVLPVNVTAQCSDPSSQVCQAMANLTDYERTTLAHIPSLEDLKKSRYGDFLIHDYNGRLYAVVLVAWVIYIYTCRKCLLLLTILLLLLLLLVMLFLCFFVSYTYL